jgi:hypothetical protein
LAARSAEKTWLDLRKQDDYDQRTFATHLAEGLLTLETALPMAQLCAALDCAANAVDTAANKHV